MLDQGFRISIQILRVGIAPEWIVGDCQILVQRGELPGSRFNDLQADEKERQAELILRGLTCYNAENYSYPTGSGLSINRRKADQSFSRWRIYV